MEQQQDERVEASDSRDDEEGNVEQIRLLREEVVELILGRSLEVGGRAVQEVGPYCRIDGEGEGDRKSVSQSVSQSVREVSH